MFFSGDAVLRAPTRPPKTTRELHVTRREDGRSELQVLHKVGLGDSREHVNRLVDFGEAPEGGFPRWSLRYIKKVFFSSPSDNSFYQITWFIPFALPREQHKSSAADTPSFSVSLAKPGIIFLLFLI